MPDVYDIGIIGMGPAGIGLALKLSETDYINNTICFEQGVCNPDTNCPILVQKDCCNSPVCNIISGVGGASTLTSGKISDFPAGSGLLNFFDSKKQTMDALTKARNFLSEYIPLKKVNISEPTKEIAYKFYSKKGIKYKYYDVYDFNGEDYRNFIKIKVEELTQKGLTLLDNTKVTKICYSINDQYFCINTEKFGTQKEFFAKKLVIATGALDIEQQIIEESMTDSVDSFEVGVRIETTSEIVEKVLSTHGDLKLKLAQGRTYCVTKQGRIVSYKSGGLSFLEGCLEPTSCTNHTNLAVLIKYDDYESIVSFAKNYSSNFGGQPIKQKFTDYIANKVSSENLFTTLPRAVSGNINDLLPEDVNILIKDFIKNVLIETMKIPENDIVLVAPELKILRNLKINKNFEVKDDLFVIGSATGKFRGILQSFCSGIRCGQILTRKE